ncbi:MAG: hypothetical protein NWE98_01470 [Candidatus Bathyarchaeota archaeon]|nr:hypothetical protein [Candidatus Bathyarchaeota archaeon]
MVRKTIFFKTLSITTILLVLSIPLFITSAASNVIFSDDFESGNFSSWTSSVGTPLISGSTVHSGNYAAKFSYAGSASCYELKTIVPTSILNYTYHVYFNGLPTNYLCVVLASDINDATIFFRVEYADGAYIWKFNAGSGQITNASKPTVSSGQWYKIQVLAFTGSNSTVYFLVNDQLKATITNQTLAQINQLRIGNDWVDFGNYIPQGETYFDDVMATNSISAFISAFAESGGSISPNGTVPVDFNGNQTFDITPNAHYHVADVKVDGVSVGPVSTFSFRNVQTIHSIEAYFAIDQNIISAGAGPNGVISPKGEVAVDFGADQSFSITPNSGYHVADVIVNGTSVGAVNSYTFTNVQAAYSIFATFAKDYISSTGYASPTPTPKPKVTPTPLATPTQPPSSSLPTISPQIEQSQNTSTNYALYVIVVIIVGSVASGLLLILSKLRQQSDGTAE